VARECGAISGVLLLVVIIGEVRGEDVMVVREVRVGEVEGLVKGEGEVEVMLKGLEGVLGGGRQEEGAERENA
jgi:hypothetical protein